MSSRAQRRQRAAGRGPARAATAPEPTVEGSRLLVVSTANTCRSVMVAALLRSRLAGRAPVQVRSAGLLAGGRSADATVTDVMARHGLNAGGHQSRRLARPDIAAADLVITLARQHAREVVVLDRRSFGRTFTLRELVRRGERLGPRSAGEALEDWLARASEGRAPADLLGHDTTDDVADLRGANHPACQATFDELVALCERAVVLAGLDRPARAVTAGGDESRSGPVDHGGSGERLLGPGPTGTARSGGDGATEPAPGPSTQPVPVVPRSDEPAPVALAPAPERPRPEPEGPGPGADPGPGPAPTAGTRLVGLCTDAEGTGLAGLIESDLRARGLVVVHLSVGDGRAGWVEAGAAAGLAVAGGEAGLVVTCTASGSGAAMAANRLPGARAVAGTDVVAVRIARQAEDANILCLGTATVTPTVARQLVGAFLSTASRPGAGDDAGALG
ncbi:MAG: RpiB/LacA/LacB family sugar-phosphate isomerase [Acidimicrobiia bacterium]